MCSLLSVSCVAFTLLDYPMSWVELTGTLLTLWSAWLIARRNVLTWPVGITAVILYLALFYQIRLYSDALEQVYYLGMSVYGWVLWSAPRKSAPGGEDGATRFSSPRALLGWALATAVLSVPLWLLASRAHLLLPAVFPEPASFPFLDALTTVMSFSAQWLMTRKRTESWVYWILVDIAAVWLYAVKDVKFLALLYVFMLANAVYGLWNWSRRAKRAGKTSPAQTALDRPPSSTIAG